MWMRGMWTFVYYINLCKWRLLCAKNILNFFISLSRSFWLNYCSKCLLLCHLQFLGHGFSPNEDEIARFSFYKPAIVNGHLFFEKFRIGSRDQCSKFDMRVKDRSLFRWSQLISFFVSINAFWYKYKKVRAISFCLGDQNCHWECFLEHPSWLSL